MNEAELLLSMRGTPQPDWRGIVGALHDADLNSPRRSTIPLVAYWQDALARLTPLQNQLRFPVVAPITFSFEHSVGVRRGRGKPSCTDLMIISSSVAIAIEAKYTEPEYETVSAWLHEPRDTNRCDVLGGWLDMLHTATEDKLTVDRVLHLPYQLIHRAASACFPRAAHRAVLYQIFDVTHRDCYLDALRGLRALVPTSSLKLGAIATPTVPSRIYAGLLARWDAGERKMGHDVRSALLKGETFTFGEPSLFFV
ncbi:MAG: hypothetical protein QME66_05035 [Candidatus Eisenbacteria bacterium]|nr:hypothetical protein [Candidatus Eisenbacteria bacterium]